MADDSALVRFEKTGGHPDPVTGKPVADTTIYDYHAADPGRRVWTAARSSFAIAAYRLLSGWEPERRDGIALRGGLPCGYLGGWLGRNLLDRSP